MGRSDLEVPGFGDATIDTDLNSSVFALIEQVRMLQGGGGTLSYSLEGTLHLAGGLRRLPFQRQGEIDFRPPPVFAPTGPAI